MRPWLACKACFWRPFRPTNQRWCTDLGVDWLIIRLYLIWRTLGVTLILLVVPFADEMKRVDLDIVYAARARQAPDWP